MRSVFTRATQPPWNDDTILRGELFSSERLELHATTLAQAQHTTSRRGLGTPLSHRLRDNERSLLAAYHAMALAVRRTPIITPAAEWLLDNFHLIEAQICEIRADLPRGYYQELPKLAEGPLAGYPRVLGIAWAFVAHTDSHFQPDALRRFVSAYQQVQPLTIGELWAISITLRILLVENLRRAAERIVNNRADRQAADQMADRVLGLRGQEADPDVLEREQGRDSGPLNAAFIVQLVLRLRDQDPDVTPALQWLERRLSAEGTSSDAIVHDEHQRQGATNVTVRNIITSMRLISDTDWSEFFESVSLVDVTLRAHGNFAQMDFATRNLYRSAVEELARGSSHTELEIAAAAMQCADEGAARSERLGDPGYYLVAGGRSDFETKLRYTAPLRQRPRVLLTRIGAGAYIALISIVAGAALALPVLATLACATSGVLRALLLLGVVPAIDAAVALVNRGMTYAFGARALPALALADGVPAALRTIVAVPTLLTNRAAILALVERLEVHHLASQDGALHFALLCDWTDADTPVVPGDQELLQVGHEAIALLNARYGPVDQHERFLLLHRDRGWSNTQQQWIGWERKRGKLHEFNRLLRGATDTGYVGTGGHPPRVPGDVRFVITLDGDTRLPRDTARRLIGKLAHPLNRPRLDSSARRVVEGYSVLQPRVTTSLPLRGEGSLFQRIVSYAPGLDPYSSTVSDVYQDLFGEGSYSGKGIYDVDAFEAVLADRVPDDTLLSHDLFEGTFARAALVSDIEVVEDFPTRYDVAAARQHRWVRGDWQLLPWLMGRRDRTQGTRGQSRLRLIGVWKMLDNLRRSLSAPMMVALLVMAWMQPLVVALPWTLFVLASLALPAILPLLSELWPHRHGISLRSHVRALARDTLQAIRQVAIQLVLLAHQACLMLDAILRTLYRLVVSQRNLLQWVTAAQTQQSVQPGLRGSYRAMAGALLLTGAIGLGVAVVGSSGGWLAVPLLLAWAASPAVAQWISRPLGSAAHQPLVAADATLLRLLARRTWRYFETFVTAEDNHLPPDNFQEDPVATVAHRSSPTNMGLYLLATVSARDFGWIGRAQALQLLEANFKTLESLQSYRGHLYNWYDSRDLRPLDPRYVSTVDSGNLAAHLITLAHALREWIASPPGAATTLRGVEDALLLAQESLRSPASPLRTGSPLHDALLAEFAAAIETLHAQIAIEPQSAAGARGVAAMTARLVGRVRTAVPDESPDQSSDLQYWVEAAARSVDCWLVDLATSGAALSDTDRRLEQLAVRALAFADRMEFGFLLDPLRGLLSIGFRAADAALDESCYDLLASEARLASFVAIAKGDLPNKHWLRLGRAVTAVGSGAALLSWSGSMFEYLMPSLVMRAPADSLLEQTNRLVVQRQVALGVQLGIPWGVSESAYNARDIEFTYQYSSFGVPSLGLKRGLGDNTVIAPYATALAAMVEPRLAALNMRALAAQGALGRYGFYEAIDYTSTRVPAGEQQVTVRAFMAHHQGMTVVAIANVLMHGQLRKRFHAEPAVRATELLLQERTPREVPLAQPRATESLADVAVEDLPADAMPRRYTGRESTPQVHLLSNGRYAVMLTAAGSGYSHWLDLAVTRWQADATRDNCGSYLYLRDLEAGTVWSAGLQPTADAVAGCTAVFTEDRATFTRRDGQVAIQLTVLVSPEDDAEVRQLAITNTGSRPRDIEVTSYAELVLARAADDEAHPAFSKLFVQTEYVATLQALLATRRRRSPEDPEVWAAHQAVIEGEQIGGQEHETDRARFLGRGNDSRTPFAMRDGRHLSNTTGTVLDPVFALRYTLRVPAGGTVRIAYWTAVAATREQMLDLVDKHRDATAFVRASTLAWTQAQVQLLHLGITLADANLFQRLAGKLLYPQAGLRPASEAIRRGSGSPGPLWSQGISGDRPIVLLRVDDMDDIPLVRQLLQAHEYWRLKKLAVDLVILNERASSYVQDLQSALETALRMSQSRPRIAIAASEGAVFLLRNDLIPSNVGALLAAVARIVLIGRRGSLVDQLERAALTPQGSLGARRRNPRRSPHGQDSVPRGPAAETLEYFNGLGGFSASGREYVTLLRPGMTTPAPWINVIANPLFGFQIGVEGNASTWALNSREHRLTPWNNDPVSDGAGEALYLRDEQSGEVWGVTAAPMRDINGHYTAAHGQGYSRFNHESHGIDVELVVFVAIADPVRISRLTLRNTSDRPRRLSVTAYVEWVLGVSRSQCAPTVITEIDEHCGALLARNPWSLEHGSRVAFLDMRGEQTACTGDRREFLGRHGSPAAPRALLDGLPLSGRGGAGLDPCGVQQTIVELDVGASVDVAILLGEVDDIAALKPLLARYRVADLDLLLQGVVDHWDQLLGGIQVTTPDRALDILLNRWALYQTLACRMWARTAFYQSSGAFGFRDQLQDAMALTQTAPAIARAHLLRAAGRQFLEGDVQHWWLAPSGQGVRTHIADDRIWLALAVAHYIRVSGDESVLEESLPFIEGRKLAAGEADAFYLPVTAEQTATVYEHSALALELSLPVGRHGLPLMGTGDWNDGMNRVGAAGQGESVWLGWFLYTALQEFAPFALARGQTERQARWLKHGAQLQIALDEGAWDGAWYRRGYYDDGTPLGSASSEDCHIDSIAQSWAVLSGAGRPERMRQAMQAVDSQLIRRDVSLALLFAPPFDRTTRDPGYIKGYPPGIRENGGQYTHAATWSVIALARLGEAARAMELFSMLNPINRSASRAGSHRYKVEPYVVPADIYSAAPHAGRGGWTWYTGAAGWLHRAGVESLLGLQLQGTSLQLTPCIPSHWDGYSIRLRHRSARYELAFDNPDHVSSGIVRLVVDGQVQAAGSDRIALLDDGATHSVAITLGHP